jgi:predicted nucleic acid-binding protein
VKWYVWEPGSRAALALRHDYPPPLVLTHLQRVEVVHAWRLKVLRRELPPEAVALADDALQADTASGLWAPPIYELAAVFDRAEALARRHAAALGTRTLDTLHVASALELGCNEMVTTDVRQARLATAAGLRVVTP